MGQDRDQFDDLLDGALKQYGDVEPRRGLEGRVLASLSADMSRSHSVRRWAWALAGATALVVVIGIWIGIGHHRGKVPQLVVRAPIVRNSASAKSAAIADASEATKAILKRRGIRRNPALAASAKAAELRLSQFPSRRPLSEQERLLKAYVTAFPEEAALMAREQAQRQKELAALGWDETTAQDTN